MVSNKKVSIHFTLIALFSFGAALIWAISPPQPEGNLIFGFTEIPLVVFLVLCFLGIVAILVPILFRNHQKLSLSYWVSHFSTKSARISFFVLLTLFLGFLWITSLSTAYLNPAISEYHARLKPLFIWGLFTSALFLGNLIRILDKINHTREAKTRNQFPLNLKALLIGFGCLLLLAAFISTTRLGILPIRHWEKNSVPVLFRQVLILVWGLAGWILLIKPWLAKPEGNTKGFLPFVRANIDIILFLSIWLIAALLWIQEPLPFNMFNPGGIAPDFVPYPNSDARHGYDLPAQKALIGVQGQVLSKPVYNGFLFLLHLVAGQNFVLLLAIQCAILAVFPAVTYLIGKKLSSRTFGLALAFFVLVQTWNAIKGNLWLWNAPHPKLQMTDFPLAVVLSIFIYFMIVWFQDQEKKTLALLCAGASLGLSVLVRDNAWVITPLPIVLILIREGKLKKWLRPSLGFILSFILVITPWMVQSYRTTGTPIYFFDKIQSVIIGDRYLQETGDATVESDLGEDSNQEAGNSESSSTNPTESSAPLQEIDDPGALLSLPQKVLGHFLHGWVTIAFSASPVYTFESLYTTTSIDPASRFIWVAPWEGSLSGAAQAALGLNLLIFSIGMSGLWKKQRWLALFPLALMTAYLFADGLAFTSGSRYAAPINWCYFLYYAFGIVVLIEKTLAALFPAINFSGISPAAGSYAASATSCSNAVRIGFLGLALLLGLTPAMMGTLRPAQDRAMEQAEVLALLKESDFYSLSEINESELEEMAANQTVFLQTGKLLYPRYLDFEAMPDIENIFLQHTPDSPFLLFTLLNSETYDEQICLPYAEIPENFQHNTEVIVIGCGEGIDREGAYVYLPNENELWVADGELCFVQ